MQDDNIYANPKFLDSWNESDWQIWFQRNSEVIECLDLTYDVKMAIAQRT